jgi:hypothetical protein
MAMPNEKACGGDKDKAPIREDQGFVYGDINTGSESIHERMVRSNNVS